MLQINVNITNKIFFILKSPYLILNFYPFRSFPSIKHINPGNNSLSEERIMVIKMTINDRIKSIRNSLNLTQTKFAERIAISTSYLAAIELGNKRAHERVVRLIINEFNISEQWLTAGKGEMYNTDWDASLAKVTTLFKSLSPEVQACAVEQLDALSDLERSLKS